MKDEGPEPGEAARRLRIDNWGRWAVCALIATAGVYLVLQLRHVLILFYLASLLGFALNALVTSLEKRGIRRPLAVVGLALMFLTGLAASISFVLPPAVRQAKSLIEQAPEYLQSSQEWVQGYLDQHPNLQSRVGSSNRLFAKATSHTSEYLGKLGDWVLRFARGIFSAFVVFVLIFFGLLNPMPMMRGLFDLTPPDRHDAIQRTLTGIQSKLVAWAGGTFLLMTIVWALISLGLSLLHVPTPLVFGIVAGVAEGVPTLGPVLASMPPIFVMLLTSPVKAVAVAILFLVVQQTESNVLVPIIMGNRLRVHPWGLLFSILAMGELFGVMGLFLATPTAAILEVIYVELIPKPGRKAVLPAQERIARVVGTTSAPDA